MVKFIDTHQETAQKFRLSRKNPNQKEIRTIYMYTVEQDDGTRRQARIDREFTGAIVRANERVTFWGTYRGGVLMVSEGWNQTVNAAIGIRRDIPLGLKLLGVVVLVVLGIILLPTILHTVLALVAPLLVLWFIWKFIIGGGKGRGFF